MKLEEKLRTYGKKNVPEIREGSLEETVRKSRGVFYRAEEGKKLSYGEFLLSQLPRIQKRWWIFQGGLLGMVCIFLALNIGNAGMRKGMGVSGVLFVVLFVPELWKNENSYSLEIEGTSYYSLREIYAARMLLFGGVDLFLISVFLIVVRTAFQVPLMELAIQFLLPLTVTAGICFGMFASPKKTGEGAAITACLFWSAIWILVLLNQKVYEALILPAWSVILTLSVVFLFWSVVRTLHNAEHYWEEIKLWN
jgi:hypothetical protein